MPQLFLETSLTNMVIIEEDGKITELCFLGKQVQQSKDETPLLHRAADELRLYLEGRLQVFTVPIAPKGTAFMQRVWEELVKIPYGTTITYKQLAEASGSPRGYRAAGMACNRNPVAILIPCHRVIGANGSLTGYAGGLTVKEHLLKIEHDVLANPQLSALKG